MKNALTKKIHGVPVWVLSLLAVVVLYLGYRWYGSRSAQAANAGSPNLGTASSYYPQNGGGGAGSISLPNTTVGESAQTPPFTAPAPADTSAPAPADTSAPATAPLASADITTVTPTDAALANPNSPEAIAASGDQPYTGWLSGGNPGYVIDSTGQVYGPSTSIDGGLRQRVGQPGNFPDAVDRYLANRATDVQIQADGVPPAPTSITQKTLPAPVDTLAAGRAVVGKAIAQ